MPWPRAVAVIIGLLLVTSGVTVAPGAPPAITSPAVATQQDFDRVEFRVTVYENGSARWTFHYERVLDNQTEQEQFEAFAETFTENETALFRDFQNQSRTLASRGQEATGREMTAERS